ncbi:hypothetical protein BGX31_001935 [Mortierella sp. GBA43]|nr:hypothetical protein BGX31_001935 [Mortierella sp. GBA43]
MVHSNGYGFHDSIPASQRSSQEAGGFRHGDDDFTHMSFVYANEKRFSEFHSVFRSVPDSEKLIEDYGCALQKEILVQGRLYISENHVCFNANIFGWVTNLVIAFSEIIAIEKKMTAFVIPNAISIVTTTNTRGHFFASFLSRDAAHDLLMAAWRKAFPCAANASVGHGHGNGYRRDRSNMAYNDDDDSNDAQSFISTRGNSESRRNRHRRSFSNASQAWIGDDGANSKEEYWPDDDETPNTNTNTGSRRRTPKKAGVRKLLKDVIAPIVPDDEQRNPNTLSPTTNGTTNGKKGRGRSLSELAPRPTSFDMARDRRDSITSTRSSFDEDSLAPKSQPRTRSPSRRPTDPVQKSSRSPPPSAPSSPLPLAVMAATAAAAAAGSAGASRAAARGPPASAPAIRAPPASAPPAAGRQSPTTCKCSKDGRHYPNQYMSEVYPGTVQSMWKLLFDSDFNKNFLTSEVMKGGDVQEEAWQTSGGAMTKTTKYIKWLGMPIGPKTTKATLTDVCEHRDFDDYVTTVTATSTPDVPSGGCFTTKVRTCISWAGPNQVQIIVTGAVEFSKSTWIKGQIEKGAADGLTTHYKELNKFIRKHVAANSKNLGSGGSKAVNGAPVSLSADRRKERLQSASPANGGGLRSKELADTVPSTPVSSTGRSSSSSSSSSTDIWSMLAKATEWNHGAVSHLALVAVLVAVMLANAYIFRQIASVSTQIEKMQDGGALLTSDHSHHHHHHHQHQQRHSHYHQDHSSSSSSSSRERPLPPAGSGRVSSSEGMRYSREMNDFEREEMFAREQEEAMWAWLLEREARHRQYRAASGVPPPPQQQQQPSPPFSAGAPGSGSSSNTEQRSPPSPAQEEKEAFWSEKNTRDWILQQQEHRARETETRLQARIAELQERLAALEQQSSAIKVETRVMEEEQDQGIPI